MIESASSDERPCQLCTRTHRPVLFLLSSGEQLDSATHVASNLNDAFFVAPYGHRWGRLDRSTEVGRPHDLFDAVRPIVTGSQLTRRTIRSLSGRPVLVAGQDIGYGERAVIAAARRLGASVVLMPDGVVPFKRADALRQTKWTAPIGNVLDRLLSRAGRLAGTRSEFGSTSPDYIISWGPAWDATWRERCPGAKIVTLGSPRADRFDVLPPSPGSGNVLVCSQPLLWSDLSGLSRQAHVWYRWLGELVRLPNPRIRLRLHPGEIVPGYALPEYLRVFARTQRIDLVDDLAWADAVIAPASTVLVEALAAGRVPISAGGSDMWGVYGDFALMTDPALPVIRLGEGTDLPTVQVTLDQVDGLIRGCTLSAAAYLSNFGTSAQHVAAFLAGL